MLAFLNATLQVANQHASTQTHATSLTSRQSPPSTSRRARGALHAPCRQVRAHAPRRAAGGAAVLMNESVRVRMRVAPPGPGAAGRRAVRAPGGARAGPGRSGRVRRPS